jgi:hypothetical protein
LRAAAATSSLVLLVIAGCGRHESRTVPQLQFETEADTAGLAQGPDILASFEPKRFDNGLLQLRGGLRLPDHTRVQISLTPLHQSRPEQMVRVTVMNERFETAPFLGQRGPLPAGVYKIELLAHFNDAWQPEDVLTATRNGHTLRGPGMVRGSMNEAAFRLELEKRL